MTSWLHAALRRRSRAVPDAVAVTRAGNSLTFAELECRAEALTRELCARDVAAGSLVDLRMPPGPDLVIALCGVLGTGAAFVVRDPSWPLRGEPVPDRPGLTVRPGSGAHLPETLGPTRPVCLLGGAVPSTSEAALGDGNLTSALLVEGTALGLAPGDTVLHRTPPHEAFGVVEILLALLSGARLAVPEVGDHGDVAVAVAAMTEQHVNLSRLPVSMLLDALELSSLPAFQLIRAAFSHRAMWTTPDLDAGSRARIEARTHLPLRPLIGGPADSAATADLAELLDTLGWTEQSTPQDPVAEQIELERGHGEQPDTRTMEAVLRCWRDVLGRGEVSLADDFFDAGGSSVTAAIATDMLVERLGTDIPVDLILRHRTPLAYAAAVHLMTTESPAGGSPTKGPNRVSERPADEALILEQFRLYTGNDRIVATQDFFRVGGDSFVAVQVARALSGLTGREIDARELFTHRTARALAAVLAVETPSGAREDG